MRESRRKLFYLIRSQINIVIMLVVITAVVLYAGGCSPVSPKHDSTTENNTSPQPIAEPQNPSDTIQNNNNNVAPEDDRFQLARNILFAWQPGWRELEKQGKRTIENGYATMVIDATEEPEAGIYIFHVYDVVEYPEEGHTSTYGWYEINTNTGEIFDSILNEKVY